MIWKRYWASGALAVVLGAVLVGCGASGGGPGDEEREPHFLEGKSRVSSMDYQAAIQSFEEALEVNPHSAAAHFELACLYSNQEPDPAAAIYHYETYLKLRPDAGNAELVKAQIATMKQQIAREVDVVADTPGMQREMEKMMEENRALTEQNRALTDELNRWRAGAGQAAIVTNPPPGNIVSSTSGSAAANQSSRSTATPAHSSSPSSSTASTSGKTYKVQAGDTPVAIARKYGLKLDALLAANPGLDPKRMKVGQVLNLPE